MAATQCPGEIVPAITYAIQRSDGAATGDWNVGVTIDVMEAVKDVGSVVLLSTSVFPQRSQYAPVLLGDVEIAEYFPERGHYLIEDAGQHHWQRTVEMVHI